MLILGFIVGCIIMTLLTVGAVIATMVKLGFSGSLKGDKIPFTIMYSLISLLWYFLISNAPFSLTISVTGV